jgi:glycosyltransferase involved in cell wall biosynthesis
MDKTGIFYFSSIPYNFLKQRPQQLYDNFKLNNEMEFFFIEPPNLNAHLKKRFKKSTSTDENILIMPFPPQIKIMGNLGNNIYQKFFSFFVSQYFDHFNFKKKVAILCTPFWEPYVSKKDFELICYDYLDSIEVYSYQGDYEDIKQKHHRLVSKSDLIFTTAKELKKDILSSFPEKEIVTVSNGVDTDFFEKNRNNVKIKDYKKHGRMVVGYVGALFDWIDIELIFKSAQNLKEFDFVLIGPLSDQNQKYLENEPDNVFFLGEKPYMEVPSYINVFDVAIIPFKKGEISETTDPIKVYEYFSLGKPVVSTYLKQLERFNDGKLLRIAKNEEEFVNALKSLIDKDNEKVKLMRKKIAQENSWAKKTNQITTTIKTKI